MAKKRSYLQNNITIKKEISKLLSFAHEVKIISFIVSMRTNRGSTVFKQMMQRMEILDSNNSQLFQKMPKVMQEGF